MQWHGAKEEAVCLLDEVEDGDSVANGREDRVAIGGEEDVSLSVDCSYQV